MKNVLRIVIFSCFFWLCVNAQAKELIISQVNIEGLNRIEESKVREVINIHRGDHFDLQRVDQAVSHLRRWGVFDKITVQLNPAANNQREIKFSLDEAQVVTLVEISGNFPYVENKIRKYLTIHAGDIYTPGSVEEQIGRIQDFYQRQGFINTNVIVKEKARPEENGIDLLFKIKHGDVLRYRNITILGNQAFPDGRFVSAINPLKSFSERRLRAAMRKLTEFYHHKGYPRAKVRVHKKHIDFASNRVDVEIQVSEGPHVTLKFYGNHHLNHKTLRKTVTILKEGSFDSFEIDASKRAIVAAYAKAGYPHTSVTAQKTLLQHKNVMIKFFVTESSSQYIKKIQFPGNKTVSEKKIKANMINHQRSTGTRGPLQPDYIDTDSKAIKRTFQAEGYLNPTIGEWKITPTKDRWPLIVSIPVNPGVKTIVKKVQFEGSTVARKVLLKKLTLKRKTAFNQAALEDDRQTILTYYANNGHPYAEVEQTFTLSDDNKTATISYLIKEGTLVKIGQILIVGDVLTSQKAIKKSMGIGTADKFSHQKILQAERNIRRLGPFSAVNVETIGLTEKNQTVHLRVKVDEQRPFLVDLEFGYSTDEQYAGALRFTNLNAFGWAKRNTLALTYGEELSRAEIGWIDPRFLGSSFEMTTNSWIQYEEEAAFTYVQLGAATGWFRRFYRFGLLFRFELDRNYFVEGSSTAADAQSLRNNTIAKTSLSASYDTRDNFAKPRKGFFTISTADLFNEIKGNEANFVKLAVAGEYHLSPFKRVTLSSTLRINRIQTFGDNVSIPSNELFFLGGDDTIRGFSEDSLGPVDANNNPTGGRSRWIFNQELRFHVARSLSTGIFYDAGKLAQTFSELAIDSQARQSVGLGLRYHTPVGPIRADYAFKLNRKAGESRARFHLTFGYVF